MKLSRSKVFILKSPLKFGELQSHFRNATAELISVKRRINITLSQVSDLDL